MADSPWAEEYWWVQQAAEVENARHHPANVPQEQVDAICAARFKENYA